MVAVLVVSSLTAACAFQSGSTSNLSPSKVTTATGSAVDAGSAPSLLGTWASQSVAIPSPSSCGNFQWTVTSQTATSLAGNFSAECPGGVSISGTASGQLVNATTIPITASGSVSLAGVQACNFSLSGTGAVEDGANTLRVPYTGSTCLGPVQGTEVLHRPAPPTPPAPSAPAPAPLPMPAPAPPPPDPLLGCGGLVGGDKTALVSCIHDRVNPPATVEGAFEVTKRVAWALRGEGAGLLIKNSGENIVGWQGRSFAAARICYPDGHIFKVLSDVPTTNGPMWLDNGFVDRSLCVPAIDPN